MFITPAHAQVGGTDPFGGFAGLIPILLMIIIFYFLLFRPQQRRLKAHQDMVASLKRNDVIVTSGGLIGKVTRVKEDCNEIEVEISDNIKVRVVRSSVTEVRSKNDPV
ncbi:MAG: preprotein translocase subunit YajC [Hyphomicrobiaceae bacterium]|nr:preprotein translocase subunit YajC [Hyphomicrobiaceae bacterium]